MNNFEQKKNKWLNEVSDDCHKFALKTDLDFYVFQTSIHYNPDILIIGINPGGNRSYSEMLEKNDIKKRSPESLYYSQNLLVEKANDWEDGMSQIRRKMKEIFNTESLFLKLQNSIMMNMFYFNTTSSPEIKQLEKDIEIYCLNKTKEFIEIVKPKNILFFTSDRSLLKQFGVNDITQIDKFLKMGTLDNSTIYAIPHFSAQGYSNDDRNIMGEQLSKVLV